MKRRFQVSGGVLFLLFLFAGAAAQVSPEMRHPGGSKTYRFDTVDYPGAFVTYATDIDTANHTIVGVSRANTSSNDQAFTFKGTTYKILQVPGAISSALTGINRSNQMVGTYEDSANTFHGFLDDGGKFTTLDYPGATETATAAINDSGLIVGWYQTYATHGFVYDHGNYSSFDYPGALGFTIPAGINSVGEIVGQWEDSSSHYHGFLLSGGVFTSLDFPQAQQTGAGDINDAGQIAGTYTDSNFHNHGFIYSGGVWQTVDVTGAYGFNLGRIKNNGQVIGDFQDALGELHGVLGH